jgi:hypothetical protein
MGGRIRRDDFALLALFHRTSGLSEIFHNVFRNFEGASASRRCTGGPGVRGQLG